MFENVFSSLPSSNVLLTITVKNEGHYINAGIGTWRLQQAFLLASHK